MTKLRKIFAVSVIALTVVAMSGVATNGAKAAAQAGDLIKKDGLSTVYYLGSDGKRYVFPHESVFFSWYSDFSSVVTVSASELSSYPLGANIVMRPGTKLVKITSDPSVYTVSPNGVLHKIQSEADAIALFGANWAQRVVDVADSFFTNYTIGTPLTSGQVPTGSLVKNSGSSNIYYYDGTNYRLFSSEAAFNANRLKATDVITLATTITGGGTSISGFENGIAYTPQNITGGIQPGQGTGLTVSLSANTPASATVPSNSARVEFAKFNLTASNDGAVTLTAIKLKRTGVGPYNDLSGVFLYDGDTRLTNSRTISSDTNMVEFDTLSYVIPAGTTKTLTVAANVGSNKTGNHAFSINAASDMTAGGATISGSFPVTGNTMSLSSTSAGTVTAGGYTSGMSNPAIGDTATNVSKFSLVTATDDGYLKAITLKQDGNIDTALLSNYKLYQSTTELPVTYSVSGRYVTLTLATPYKLVNGSTKTFFVKADISANTEAGKTIVFYLNNAADVLVTGSAYNFGMAPTITAWDTAGESQTLTVQGGGVVISNKSAAASDVKVNSTDVELMKVGIKANVDTVQIQKMTLSLATVKQTSGGDDYGTYLDADNDAAYDTGETLLIKNIKIKDADTNQTLGSAKAITDATNWASGDVDVTLNFTYDDYFSVSKGTTRNVKVVADVDSNQISNVTYQATLNFNTASFTVKDSNDTAITDIVPATTISGNILTTKTSSLTVSRATTPESRTVVKGSVVDALGMIFATGSGAGNDVRVSGITLDTYVDANADGAFTLNTETETVATPAQNLIQEVNLYVDGTLIAGPVAVDSNGKAVFSSSKFVGGYYNIAAGSSKTIVARATISSTGPYGANEDSFSFTLDSADITADDANGAATVTVTGTDLNDTTSPTVAITVTTSGTITSSADGAKPDSQILIAGLAAEQEVHRIKLAAAKENFVVDKMTITVSQAGSYDDVEYVKLYDIDGNSLSGLTGVNLDSNGDAIFTGLNITVQKLVDKVIVVKAKLNAIGERTVATDGTAGIGADSGDALTFTMGTAANEFHAVGQASSVTDTQADAAAGNAMVVRKSKPVVTALALPTPTLADGTKVLGKFSVTASSDDVILKMVTPTMTLNDADAGNELAITAGSVYLYDVTGGTSTKLNTTGTDKDLEIEIDDAKAVRIVAGQTRTFEIRGTVTGSEASDSVETVITTDSAALSGGTVAGTETAAGGGVNDAVDDGNDNFIWSDDSADTFAVTSTEWTNGYLISNWPTDIWVLSR